MDGKSLSERSVLLCARRMRLIRVLVGLCGVSVELSSLMTSVLFYSRTGIGKPIEEEEVVFETSETTAAEETPAPTTPPPIKSSDIASAISDEETSKAAENKKEGDDDEGDAI